MNYRTRKLYKQMTSYLACAYAEGFAEGADANEADQLTAWQYLADSGECWQLQGWYGRTVTNLIEQGIIKPPKEDHKDYYGNIVRGRG